MHLVDALLGWLDADERMLDPESDQDKKAKLMEQVRFSLLPLWYIAGRSKSHGFSKFTDESINMVFKLMRMSSTCLIDTLRDGPPTDLTVRLTKHSEALDLSGCPQINELILLLSVLPISYFTHLTCKKSLKSFLTNPEVLSQRTLPILCFESVKEIDISKSHRLGNKFAIKCFSKSFPSLRKLRAAYLLNIKVPTMLNLLQNFRQLAEVDLTVDTIPVEALEFCSSPDLAQTLPRISLKAECNSFNITRLTLEGRSDICDMDLWNISRFCDSLCYLNIKGCALVSDACISFVIQNCKKLHSLIVCYTSFSVKSILALCNEHTDSNSVASNLQMLHMSKCEGISETLLLKLISKTQKMKSLSLRDTNVSDRVLCEFMGSSLEALDISNTMISWTSLAGVIRKNPNLKSLKAKGCKNLHQLHTDNSSTLFNELEVLEIGWGLSYFALQSWIPAVSFLRAISIGLGASLCEDALKLLPSACPLLESVVLYFQEISDSAVTSIVTSLKHLQELVLSYCLGDISVQSFKFYMPNLRKLRLERVTRWMTNDDLLVITQSCPNLTELFLVGCLHLNSDSQPIISAGWPGLISLHLEECGRITENGVTSLYDCIALEDISLRHNGSGIHKSFLLDAAFKFPMLRLVSLDMCDAKDGEFDVPEENESCALSIVKISRCKSERRRCLGQVHRDTLVLSWNGQNFTNRVFKQRL